jgi:hypothetical protein
MDEFCRMGFSPVHKYVKMEGDGKDTFIPVGMIV